MKRENGERKDGKKKMGKEDMGKEDMAKANGDSLKELFSIIQSRVQDNDQAHSYSARMVAQGKARCARKFGEEAVELIVAALAEDESRIISESADLLYHWLLLMASLNISLEKIDAELEARMRKKSDDQS